MKMPASETAPMAPSLIATRGLSGAACAAAGEATFGLQLLAGILLQECAAEEGGLSALSNHDAAVAAHLHRDLVAERAREIGRLLVVDDEPRVVPGRHAAVEKGAVQEHRYDVVTGDAQHRRMPRMQVGNAHALGPVAVNAGVDAPFQRNGAARE